SLFALWLMLLADGVARDSPARLITGCVGLAGSAVGSWLLMTLASRLQLEHPLIAAAGRHELIVGAELDHSAAFEYADPVGVANRGEPMRDQDRREPSSGAQDAVEDLRLAAHVEL